MKFDKNEVVQPSSYLFKAIDDIPDEVEEEDEEEMQTKLNEDTAKQAEVISTKVKDIEDVIPDRKRRLPQENGPLDKARY